MDLWDEGPNSPCEHPSHLANTAGLSIGFGHYHTAVLYRSKLGEIRCDRSFLVVVLQFVSTSVFLRTRVVAAGISTSGELVSIAAAAQNRGALVRGRRPKQFLIRQANALLAHRTTEGSGFFLWQLLVQEFKQQESTARNECPPEGQLRRMRFHFHNRVVSSAAHVI